MKLWIAGVDESATIGRRVEDEGRARAASARPSTCHPAYSALRLRECRDELDYFRRYLALLAHRHIIEAPAPVLRETRNPLRRLISQAKVFVQLTLLKRPLDRITCDQTRFNQLALYATQFDGETMRRELEALRARVDELEKKLNRNAP